MKKKKKILPRKIPTPSDFDIVGIVIKALGNDRMLVKCQDGNERICRIRGTMKRKVWIREGDIVLISPWDVQSNIKGDIIYRYNRSDIKLLKKKGYLTIQ